MVWAAPALAAATLCLCVCTEPVKAAAAALILGAVLSSAEHPHLGALGCDLEPGTILASDPNILENLKLCPALTGPQRDALNALLLSGDTAYGDPPSWDLQTLQDLGPLVLALNQTTLSLVGEAAREDFRRSIAAAYISQGHSQREKSLLLLRALAAASAASRPRLKRSSARCESEPITASNIIDAPFILLPEELELCLSSEVLMENLEAVLTQPITTQVSRVLKKKVDEFFPSGIPEEQLRRLGQLSRLYTEQEISQWPVTTSDTLSALLDPSGGEWNDSQMQQLLSRYLALGGSLSGPLLQEIGGKHLCELGEEQIRQIPPGAIGTAGQLNISSCSQTKKEQLYGKAREAFASLASSPGPYYCGIRPYLGGAPAEDLKGLANAGNINMDLDTFLTLNPQEFQKLSVTDVKNLLGENNPELRKAEQEPWVLSWLQRQPQRELDCVLGISLQGGLPPPSGTASPAGATTPATVTSMATVTSPVPTTPATVTSIATVTSPVPTTPATVTSMATVTSPVPTTPATVTSTVTAPTPPQPSARVTVPIPTAISSHSTPQPSTGPPSTPTPRPPSPTPPDTPAHTGGPPVPPSTPTARPIVSTAAPCSTHQAATTDRATSPAATSLATSSPSATPVPAVTSGATTSTSAGTNLAGATHSTVTNLSSAPTAIHSTVTTVPNPSSTPTATHSTVPNLSSAPIATHTAVIVTNPTIAPTVTTVPNPSSVATATHSTVTPGPNPCSAATANHSTVPNPSSPTVTPVPSPSPAATATHSTVTTVPNPTSTPTAIHTAVTSVPNPSSVPTSMHSTVTPVLNPSPAATATHSTVPNPSSAPTAPPVPPSPPATAASPVPIPTRPSPGSALSVSVPCQPSSPPRPPGPEPTPDGYISLQPPEPGSASRLCSCLLPVLATTVGNLLLRGLL